MHYYKKILYALYAIKKGLNGIMFWELTLDKQSGGLLDVIDQVKKTN